MGEFAVVPDCPVACHGDAVGSRRVNNNRSVSISSNGSHCLTFGLCKHSPLTGKALLSRQLKACLNSLWATLFLHPPASFYNLFGIFARDLANHFEPRKRLLPELAVSAGISIPTVRSESRGPRAESGVCACNTSSSELGCTAWGGGSTYNRSPPQSQYATCFFQHNTQQQAKLFHDRHSELSPECINRYQSTKLFGPHFWLTLRVP